jgi:pyrroline-5-carboxylate reductase
LNNTNLSFIGAGNMARSLISGLIENDHNPSHITVSDINNEQLLRLKNDFAVNITSCNKTACSNADVVVLAVKPQIINTVIRDLKQALIKQSPLLVSIAAGVKEADISRWIGQTHPIIRCMPNTPALVGAGATALLANTHVSDKQKRMAESMLGAVGITAWVEQESELDAITALSGSGPAYFFLVVEHMINSAVQLGLTRELAETFARQTAWGAAKMLAQSNTPAAELRENVTSKGGTTAAALESYKSSQLDDIIFKSMNCAYKRSIELGKQLGEDQ